MKKQSTYDILIVVLFLAVISTPVLIMLARIPQGQPIFAPKPVFGSDAIHGVLLPGMIPTPIPPPATSRLRRWLRPFADWNMRQTHRLQDFNTNFAGNLGGRDTLLALHAHLMTRIFQASPNKLVMLGKNNWLFYTGNSSTEGYRGIRPFTASELEILKSDLERRRDSLAQRGIAYLVVLAPDKQTIYPEYMPDYLTRLGRSRIEQVVTYLRAKTSLAILDLRPPLIASKSRGEMYFPTDSHWNRIGAFIGYQQIANKLKQSFPKLRPLQMEDCLVTPDSGIGADLAGMIGIQPQFNYLLIQPKRQIAQNVSGVDWGYSQREIEEAGLSFTRSVNGEIPRGVIFHDSFSNNIAPFLSRHFRRAVYVWNMTHVESIISREKPDVVIDEFVERSLYILTGRPNNANDY